MGCPLSSQPVSSSTIQEDDIMTNYKARLERKICWSRETPEDIFDISECNLKDVPSGVFVICGVLRKRQLLLNVNRLTSLKGGGQLSDLQLLYTLNLSGNLLKRLPDEINQLANLRELFVAQNRLEVLPASLNRLQNLEHLDVSHNRLTSVDQVVLLVRLKILNLSGNKIVKLSKALATCTDLLDLIFDVETVADPPPEVSRGGTANVLKYLSEGEFLVHPQIYPEIIQEPKLLNQVKNPNLDGFHAEQDRQRRELLQKLQAEQTEVETKVREMQNLKENEKAKLIEEIRREEDATKAILDNILCLKNGPDPAILAQEIIEREKLLETVQQTSLRRQEVIARMTSILNEEMETIQCFQTEKAAVSRSVLEQEEKSNILLMELYKTFDKGRETILHQIAQDEALQKSAVATLIAKNDARSWGLMEQIRILEAELAKLTNLEIEKKNLCITEQVNELAARRIEITDVLANLLSQQDKRRTELIQTLEQLGEAKNSPDFWLLQYQKLLDQQPSELAAAVIDPQLGYEFLKLGVVHCLPFLARIWQDTQTQLEDITNDDLLAAGIRSEHDRLNILQSIATYVGESQGPSAPVDTEEEEEATDLTSECVVCMNAEVRVLFFPCGHLCCCLTCHTNLEDCPMCRTPIERRIKVIQS